MESLKYGRITARGQTRNDDNALARNRSNSSLPAVMTWDRTYDAEDLHLGGEGRKLHLNEKDKFHQRTSVTRRKNELQRTTMYRQKHDEYRGDEWKTRRETEPNFPSRPHYQYQEAARFTERQVCRLTYSNSE